ncbi:hypothetical protein FW774_07750 [Pedobacter sp. BS3]|uniref:hypothetical protein n=1 Tax=Pedobacter sp. BS3 TaxID=2567937 RepID=UPI0011EDEB1F|nr:hypothetical protein [Pedobacter sp. BS3]TZF84862.1 hypothetical protein FW774_07750 [Pedobacter sp. BS3]
MKTLHLLIALLFTGFITLAQELQPANVHFDKNHWIEYIEGNMPLVISVPHGGTTLVEGVPLRSCKGAVTVTDTRTIELAREIEKAFIKKYNLRPHIIICNISRKNVDQNRDVDEATCGNELMKKPWEQFHHYIDSAISLATAQYGKTLYIDLHGHGHKKQRLELGYLLRANELKDLNKSNEAEATKKSSLSNLLADNSKLSLTDLLTSNIAFGTMIANSGFPAVPSKQDKAPEDGDKYFNGGYNTARYCKYPNVHGWQIESNYKGVRDPEGRPLFADAFAQVIMKFIDKNTSLKIKK